MKKAILFYVFLVLLGCTEQKEQIPQFSDITLLAGGYSPKKPDTWTEERAKAHVTYTDESGKEHWLFEAFIFWAGQDYKRESFNYQYKRWDMNIGRNWASTWHTCSLTIIGTGMGKSLSRTLSQKWKGFQWAWNSNSRELTAKVYIHAHPYSRISLMERRTLAQKRTGQCSATISDISRMRDSTERFLWPYIPELTRCMNLLRLTRLRMWRCTTNSADSSSKVL